MFRICDNSISMHKYCERGALMYQYSAVYSKVPCSTRMVCSLLASQWTSGGGCGGKSLRVLQRGSLCGWDDMYRHSIFVLKYFNDHIALPIVREFFSCRLIVCLFVGEHARTHNTRTHVPVRTLRTHTRTHVLANPINMCRRARLIAWGDHCR